MLPKEADDNEHGDRHQEVDRDVMSKSETTMPINMAALEAVLTRASELNAQLDRLFLDAGAITGDTEDNGFTYEAIYSGGFKADELVRTIAAGHYVRERYA